MKFLKEMMMVTGVVGLSALAGCGTQDPVSSTAAIQPGPDAASNVIRRPIPHAQPILQLTGRLRMYAAGSQHGLQLDVKSVGGAPVFGPDVTFDIQQVGFFGDQHLYPYWGGNISQPNTVFPGDFGYVQATLPQGGPLSVGQRVHVTVRPLGASNFLAIGGDVTVCQKGTVGCE